MAGYTAFTVGIIRNAVSWIPIKTINQAETNKISVYDTMWQRLVGQMRMKSLINDEFKEAADKKIREEESK